MSNLVPSLTDVELAELLWILYDYDYWQYANSAELPIWDENSHETIWEKLYEEAHYRGIPCYDSVPEDYEGLVIP